MRAITQSYLLLPVALFAALTACQRDEAAARVADVQIDSGAIASAAAEAIVTTLRGARLSDTAPPRRWMLTPGPTNWDTLFVRELERAEPSMASSGGDGAGVTTVSTYGFASRGDTVDVMVVVRSCEPADTVLNYTRDSLVHRLVRSGGDSDAMWRLAGPVSHDHAVGECEATAVPAADSPNG